MSYFDVHDLENIQKNPFCIHGPTVLFENVKESTMYYSCSAIRNHKKCNFYQLKREFDDKELEKWTKTFKKCQIKKKRAKRMRLKLKSMSKSERWYCKTCDKFLFNNKQKEICEKHTLMKDIKKGDLREPTKLIINAISDDDSNAVSIKHFLYSFQ
jgi:hypothetical protein